MARILVIDDDNQICVLLRTVLERAGHEVEVALDGRSAIRLFEQNPTDLVVTDILMPDMEGVETILELRRRFPEVKVIAISGGGRISAETYLDSAKRFGAHAALTKPIEEEVLLATINRLIAERTPRP